MKRRRFKPLVVDSFAGAGGASYGMQLALGRGPDLAINHDAEAIRMHLANHPQTRHMTEDVWKVDPRGATRGKHVGLLWASPDCRHFSRAKGAKPVEKSIRSLAWVVVKWAAEVRPDRIILENVREFADWGPVVPAWRCQACNWRGTEGQAVLKRTRRRCPRCESLRLKPTDELIPDPSRKGLTFRRFVGRLKAMGYHVEHRNLNAADYGAPTHRRRLFLIARCDGLPIEWPEPTHADPKKLDAMPLFDRPKAWRTAAECIDWSLPCPSIFDRPRPLAEATLRRIALGIKRYVLENPKPFIVGVGGRMGQSHAAGVDEPNNTVTSKNDRAVVQPYLVRFNSEKSPGDLRAQHLSDPFTTLDTQNRFGLVAPTLIQIGYGERDGQSPRVPGLDKPHGSIVAGGGKAAIVAAFLAKHFGGVVGHALDEQLGTVTAKDHHSLVAANLVKMNHGDKQWYSVQEPLPTVTSQGNKFGLVYSFLIRYFGTAIGQHLTEPMFTVTGKDRFGLVVVEVAGEPYVIADIGMRMLSPRELARAQGFPDEYVLTGTKSNQTARIGNSVCPVMAEALVRANCFNESVAV